MALLASQQWWIRAGGNAANGGGYDAAIAGAGTNYADQDAAQVTFSSGNANRLNAAQNNVTVTSDGTPFTSAMVGNVIRIDGGTNWVTGYYAIATYVSTSQITVDRFPCTAGAGSIGTGRLGGAMVSPVDLCTAASGFTVPSNPASPLAAGHTVNIRGTGASPDWDVSAGYIQFPAGTAAAGYIKWRGIGTAPLFYHLGLFFYLCTRHSFENLRSKQTVAGFTTYGFIGGSTDSVGTNLECDQGGFDATQLSLAASDDCYIYNSGGGAAGTAPGLVMAPYGPHVWLSIENLRGIGVQYMNTAMSRIAGALIRGCGSHGIDVPATNELYRWAVSDCVIHGNGGDGLKIADLATASAGHINNNAFTNNVGKGVNFVSGGQAQLERSMFMLPKRNAFRGNNAPYGNLTAGLNDITLTEDPYTNAAGDDFGWNSAAGGGALVKGIAHTLRGSSTISYKDVGFQHQDAGGAVAHARFQLGI